MRDESVADDAPDGIVPAAWLGTTVAGLLLLGINSVFTVLRETPSFWLNSGGYPVALRELVQIVYYPLLGLDALICLAVGALAVLECSRHGRKAWWAVSVAALIWALLALNVGWMAANNVENFLAGRELHYHPPAE